MNLYTKKSHITLQSCLVVLYFDSTLYMKLLKPLLITGEKAKCSRNFMITIIVKLLVLIPN